MRRNTLTGLVDTVRLQARQTLQILDLLAQDGVSYRTTSADPSDLEFTRGDWDGSGAAASFPNPSDEDTDLSTLDDGFVFRPEGDEARDSKSNWKAPFRQSPDGPAHVDGLLAVLQAINGGRGGFEGISRDVLRDGYDFVVDALVEAGQYDDRDEAPDFAPATAADVLDDLDDGHVQTARQAIIAQDGFDPATETEDGLPAFPSRDAAEQAAEFVGGCSGAHEMEIDGETMWMPCGSHDDAVEVFGEAAGPDDGPDADVDVDLDAAELTAEATGAMSVRLDDVDVEASASDNGLVGVIWGAGDHDLRVGGDPTPVRVPPDTIPDTFEALREDVESGDVTIGLDHADDQAPVLAETGLIDIAEADEVALSADERNIVLTDSTPKNDQVAEALEAGAFDGFDFSIKANVAIATDDNGDKLVEDGRIVLAGARVTRIDAVEEGAVDAADIGTIPDLAEQASAVRQAADANDPMATAQALQATAEVISETMDSQFNTDPDDLEAAQEALESAEQVIEDLEAQSSAFEDVLDAADVDVDDHDDAESAAQAVIDAHTEDIRSDIAEYEAELAAYDTGEDDVDDRVEDLAGSSPAELRATRGDLAHEFNQAVQAAQAKGAGVTQDDKDGHSPTLSGSSDIDDETDELAHAALGSRDRIELADSDLSAAQFVQKKYDLDPSDFGAEDALAAEIQAKAAGVGGD